MKKILKVKSIYELFILSILISTLSIATIVIINRVVYNEKKVLLQELCQNQKDLIQSVYTETNDVNVVLAILHRQQQINEGLGTSGEYNIGYLKNDSINFLLRSRQKIQDNSLSVPVGSSIAIPMQFALQKNSGFIKGIDYSGKNVLSYVTYIPELKWGLVTKMDLWEVRRTFYIATFFALGIAIIIFLTVAILFRMLVRPITKRLELSEENYHSLFKYAAIPIWKQDCTGVKKYIDTLKLSGIKDFRAYFENNDEEVKNVLSLMKVVEINQKSVEFFNAGSKEDVINNMLFYFSKESLEIFMEELIAVAEYGKLFNCEMPMQTFTGENKILDMHFSVLKGSEDNLSNILVSFVDITERKKVETALRESEERFRILVEQAADGIFQGDCIGNFIGVNTRGEEMTGYSKEELLKMNMADLFSAQEKERTPLRYDLLKEGHFVTNERMLTRKDGSVCYVEMHTKMMPDETYQSILRDITERKKTEEALRQSEERFKAIAEASPLGIAVIGIPEGKLFYTNKAYSKLFGYKKDDLISQYTPEIYWNHSDHDIVQQILKDNNNIAEYEVIFKKKNGKMFWGYSYISPIEYDGNPAMLCTYSDISVRKKAEEAHKESEEKLKWVLNATQESIYVFDRDGNFTMSNTTGLKRLNNIHKKELLGHHFSEFISPDLAGKRQEQIDEVLRTRKPVEFEDEIDGINLHHKIFPVFREKEIVSLVVYSTDITERKQIEDALLFLLKSRNSRVNENFFKLLATFLAETLSMDFVCIDILKNDLLSAKTLAVYYEGNFIDNTEYTLKGTPCEDVVGKNVCSFKENVQLIFPNYALLQELRADSFLGATIWNSEGIPIGLITLISRKPKKNIKNAETILKLVAIKAAGELERMMSEEALHESEAKLHTIFESSVDAIGVSKEGIHIFENPAYRELFGYSSSDELAGKPISNLIVPSERKIIRQSIRQRATGEVEASNFEGRGIRKDHSEFDAEIRVSSYVSNGETFNVVIIRDITERKYAEELLKNSEIRYRSLFVSSKDGILILNADTGMIIDVNPFMIEKLGYTHEVLLGKTIWDLGLFKDIVDNQEIFLKLQQNGYVRYDNLPLKTAEGNEIDVEFISNVYYVNQQKVIQCNIRDITERIQFENELKAKNVQLKELDDSKNKFFKIIAHDMKNPFISLLGASELLYENVNKYDKTKIVTLIKILNDSAKSGYDMLLNLLEWARAQSGSMIFYPEKLNLITLINNYHLTLKEFASNKKISLNYEISPDINVYADKNMLNTVLRNLINNALKFTPKGGSVTIGAKIKTGFTIISVKDTGVGIDESDLDKLFRMDIKFSHPGTEHEGGSGLGLLLCKEFAEKHGGKIWLESKKGKGSTFYFSIKNNKKDE
jgi:hypothetical protein